MISGRPLQPSRATQRQQSCAEVGQKYGLASGRCFAQGIDAFFFTTFQNPSPTQVPAAFHFAWRHRFHYA
jgi:hypothetical protein